MSSSTTLVCLRGGSVIEGETCSNVLSAERSEADRTLDSGGRSIALGPSVAEDVGELDRRQIFGISPNSRLSRGKAPSSYLQGRDTSKMSFEHFIGIDIAKAKFDVALGTESKVLQFNNDSTGHAQLSEHLPVPGSCLIVMEATGGYEKSLAVSLVDQGHVVAVVNPRQVRDFAKAVNILAKTDKIDARVIAKFGQLVRPRAVAFANEKQDELDQLVTRRRQLIGTRTAEKNRQGQATSKVVRKSIQQILDALNRDIRRIDAEIAKLVQSNDDWKPDSKSLRAHQVWERSSQPHWSLNCPSWELSTETKSALWLASFPSIAIAERSKANDRSSEADPESEVPCTWPL